MLAPTEQPVEAEGIGTLVSRLIDDGREVVRAEVELGKTVAMSRFGKAKLGLIMTAAGALLVPSAVTTLLVGCLLGLRPIVGPFAAGLIVSLVTLAVAGLLAKLGIARMSSAISGDGKAS